VLAPLLHYREVFALIEPSQTESPVQLASLLDAVLDASTLYSIVATDLQGSIIVWNEGAHRIYGYSRQAALGKNLRMLHRPEDVSAGLVDSILRAARTLGQWEGVAVRVRENGQTFAARLVVTARRDAQKNPIGFLSISKDISEEVWLEQRLKDSEAYSRGLIESAIDGILITSLEGIITDVNKEMEGICQKSREELVGSRLSDLIVPASAAHDAMQRILANGRVQDLELRLRQPSGFELDVSCNATIFHRGREQVTSIIAAIRDVSESKRLREQLELRNRELEVQNERVQQANRLKSEFLASMSHELRTPLNSIIGFSDFLLTADDHPLDPEQREYLTDILNSGNHLLSLINDVLDLAKVESGKLQLHPVEFTLRDAVDEVCSSLRPQRGEHELSLTVDVSADIDRVVLDVVRFKQILYNLLSNAVKFTPKGGHIGVEVLPINDVQFVVRVSDSGIGIAEKDLPRIFREFEQLDSGTARRYAGTGLGLPVTRKLVERMAGAIHVESRVGVGSTFTVTLPLVRLPGASFGTAGPGKVVG